MISTFSPWWSWSAANWPARPCCGPSTRTTGALISACRCGRGLGTDVVLALCEYGFAVRGLHRLQVDTLASNAAMIGGAERAGFTLEGTLRGAAWVNGEFVDEVILGLLASDWTGARLRGTQQGALQDQRHEQLAVAVLVEQHRDVVAVVALHRALAPALAHHARAHRERDLGRRGSGRRGS